ncbi:MAG: hypothetical protein LUE21_04805 [Oscillospiraceae bacterium]|nr:hypothetical protein [Oscillospiraceae bacterium]
MEKKEKAQGFQYAFTPSELKALLFRSRKCPLCAERLIRERTCERVMGRDVNSRSDPFFIPNARVNRYGYIFRCRKCGRTFTLREFAEKR